MMFATSDKIAYNCLKKDLGNYFKRVTIHRKAST